MNRNRIVLLPESNDLIFIDRVGSKLQNLTFGQILRKDHALFIPFSHRALLLPTTRVMILSSTINVVRPIPPLLNVAGVKQDGLRGVADPRPLCSGYNDRLDHIKAARQPVLQQTHVIVPHPSSRLLKNAPKTRRRSTASWPATNRNAAISIRGSRTDVVTGAAAPSRHAALLT